MSAWRFIELKDLEPYRFHCMREALAISVGEGAPNTLLFTQLSGEHVSVGRMASISQMVHLDFCKENSIPIIRSFSSVKTSAFIDSNSIRCLAVANKDTVTSQLFYKAAEASLKGLGLGAKHIPKTNNILVKGKKVSVCSVQIHENSILFPWSIALDFNHNRAEKAISSPKNMRKWVTTVNKELAREVLVDELKDAVKRGFRQALGITFKEGKLNSEELDNIEGLLPKYTSETWLKLGRWSPVKEYRRAG